MLILLALVFEHYFFAMCVNCMLVVLFGSVKNVNSDDDLLVLSKMPNKQCEL